MAISTSGGGGGASVEDRALQMLTVFGDPHEIAPRIREFQKARADAEAASAAAKVDRDRATDAQNAAQDKINTASARILELQQLEQSINQKRVEHNAQVQADLATIDAAKAGMDDREAAVAAREQKIDGVEADLAARIKALEEKEATINAQMDALDDKHAKIVEFAQAIMAPPETIAQGEDNGTGS